VGVREIVISSVVPALIAGVVLGFGWVVWPRMRKREGELGGGVLWLLPVLVGGLTLFGAYAWQTRVEVWADAATHRFPAVGIAAAVAGLIAWVPLVRRRWWAQGVVAAVGGGFVAWAFLSTVHPDFLSVSARWGWVAGLAVVAGVQGVALEGAGRVLFNWRGPALLWMLVGTVGLGATGGFANAPLIVGGAAGAFGVLAVIGLVPIKKPAVAVSGGGGVAAAVLLVGLAAFANWLGDEERWLMLGLLLAAPVGAGLVVVLRKPLKLDERRNLALVVAAVPALGLAGAQAGMAVPALIEASGGGDPYGDYGY
jgi:hypothetical protein